MIQFQEPYWLLVLLPTGVLFWLVRPATAWLFALRASVVLLCCLALARPSWQLKDASGTVVLVADRSLSMPASGAASHKEAVSLLVHNMARNDLLGVVSFGEQVMVERAPAFGEVDAPVPEVGGEASSLAEAIDRAVSLIPDGDPGRILVVSDGRFTGDAPAGAAFRAAARGIPIDHRLLARPEAGDIAIEKMSAPQSVPLKEGFTVSAFVRAPVALEVTYELTRDNTVVAAGGRRLAPGLNRLVFRDRLSRKGAAQYTLRVMPKDPTHADPVPENNTARLLVTAEGAPPVLLVTQTPGGGLERLLTAGGVEVRSVKPGQAPLDLAQLSGVSAVILENIAAAEMPGGATETLAQWVRSGGGLLMTGGKKSFGPGGYFKGPLDPILPVSMELKQEHRKLSLAIVTTLDCSGSMGAPCPGASGKTKMDMANLGAAQVVELLSPMDEFGAIAVDTEAHEFVAIGPNTNPQGASAAVRRIGVTGGGIYINAALAASAKMLKNAKPATKHLILFADACDSEQEVAGEYKRLVPAMVKDGMTVSVIGMGSEKDPDANLLKDIAKLGGGQCYFAEDPGKIPQFFAQDTFTVARSTFVEETTAQSAVPGMTVITGRAAEKFPAVGGYNLTYAKEGTVVASVSKDEYAAPICASWRVGAGRVAVYAAEVDGKFTGPMGQWAGSGHFFTSLARFVAAKDANEFAVTQEVEDGVARVRVHLSPQRAAFGKKPVVHALQGAPGRAPAEQVLDMQWEDADTLVASVPMRAATTTLCSVNMEEGSGPDKNITRLQLPPVRLPYPPEYALHAGGAKAGQELLSRLSQATGGVDRADLGSIWGDIPRRPRLHDWTPWVLVGACAFLLLEVLERRTALVSGALAFAASAGRAVRRLTGGPSRPRAAVAADSPKPGAPANAPKAAPATGKTDPLNEWRDYVAKQKAKEAGGQSGPGKPQDPPPSSDGGVLGALGQANKKRKR